MPLTEDVIDNIKEELRKQGIKRYSRGVYISALRRYDECKNCSLSDLSFDDRKRVKLGCRIYNSFKNIIE